MQNHQISLYKALGGYHNVLYRTKADDLFFSSMAMRGEMYKVTMCVGLMQSAIKRASKQARPSNQANPQFE